MKIGDIITPDYDEHIVPVDPRKVENVKNAKYVGLFSIKDRHGNWSDEPVQIYWQEKPPVEGYSNYFAIFVRNGTVYITSGGSVTDEPIYGYEFGGKVYYSRATHDYRQVADAGFAIDGGRSYMRIVGNVQNATPLTMEIQGPHLVVTKIGI